MFFNLTLYSFSISSFYHSMMLSPVSYSLRSSKMHFEKIHVHHFFTSFYYDCSNHVESSFIYSSFVNFLNTPIVIESKEYKIIKKSLNTQQFADQAIFTVIGCTFSNCIAKEVWGENEYKRGGAIRYHQKEESGIVTIYGTTFDNCKTDKGDGGAIFVCKTERETQFDSSHEFTTSFNSSYCCYSKCSAYGTSKEREAGFGPVMFIFATSIEVFYSSSVDCPAEGNSYGAQFDLKSESIRSSYINSTKGEAEYCIAMEYRNAIEGYFKYQTFIDLTGGFLTSFTDIDKVLDISYCNYINDYIKKPKDQNGAFIYVRNCDVNINNFCFVGIKIDQGFDFVHFDNGGHSIILKNSYIEKSIESYLNGVTTIDVSFYPNEGEKYTNIIELLGLGPCEGEMPPPPTIFSKTFVPTKPFSDSFDFTESQKFSQTDYFTKTGQFTETDDFTESQKFKETDKFSESTKFSKSDKFSESQKFSKSDIFSESQKFSKSDDISTLKFSHSSKFTESRKFSNSQIFTGSFEFSNSNDLSYSEKMRIPANDEKQEDDNKKGLTTPAIVGIAIAAVAAAGIVVAVFFIIRAKKKPNFISESADMNTTETNSINTANPIYGIENDDPFKEDFN